MTIAEIWEYIKTATGTLTNKTISGSSNTLSSIGNSSLTNSAITINGTSTSLGGTIDVRPLRVRLASDQTTTSSTMAGVTGVSVAVSAGISYRLEIMIKTACDNTGGVKLGLAITGSPTFDFGRIAGQNASTTGLKDIEITAIDGSSVGNWNTVAANGESVLVCSFTAGSSGTAQLTFASNVATQLSTIRTGTIMILTPLK